MSHAQLMKRVFIRCPNNWALIQQYDRQWNELEELIQNDQSAIAKGRTMRHAYADAGQYKDADAMHKEVLEKNARISHMLQEQIDIDNQLHQMVFQNT